MQIRRQSDPFDPISRTLPERNRPQTRAPIGRLEPARRQPAATIAFYWGTVIAIVIAVAAISLRDVIEDKPLRAILLDLHRQLGVLVLLCVPLRQAVRYLVGHKQFPTATPAMLRWAARLSHALLYAFLIAIPLVGWAVTSAHAVDLRLLGLVSLPALVGPD